MNTNFLILIFSVFVLLLTAGVFIYMLNHEYAHKLVYEEAGYVNVTTTFDVVGGHTSAVAVKGSNYGLALDANLLTEIIGYHFLGLIYNLWLMAIFIVVSFAILRWRKG